MRKKFIFILLAILSLQLFALENKSSKEYNIEIKAYIYQYGGKIIKGYKYIDSSTNEEAKIIVNKGDSLTLNIKNETEYEVTNIHWHGLRVPNTEDGPKVSIKKGEKYTYKFTVKDSGTYWYHSHTRPVRDQVDEGMYAPLIVLDPNEKYSQDLLYILDDVGGKEEQSSMNSMNHSDNMEIIGKIKTINGVESSNLESIKVKKGERIKLRFLNASTAETQNIYTTKHEFIVTHLDGMALNKPYKTKKIELSPAQRVELEMVADKTNEIIKNSTGSFIKLEYIKGEVKTPKSPFIPSEKLKLSSVKDFKYDREIILNSKMDHTKENMMSWTIDDKEFPNVTPIEVKSGQIYKLRIRNNDTKNIHAMDHPMHLHGEHFQVVSVNGKEPNNIEYRDTVNIPAGGYVDIAFKIDEKGEWMFHCHILDHEDAGMMMQINVI